MFNIYLFLAAIFTGIAALLHLGCIIFGASWYRFFGAGEHMVTLAEQGDHKPDIITFVIILILTSWSCYALSAVGIIKKLPLIRTALIIISTIYIVRGVAGFFLIANPMDRSPEFWLYSSIICFSIGSLYLIGLRQNWRLL